MDGKGYDWQERRSLIVFSSPQLVSARDNGSSMSQISTSSTSSGLHRYVTINKGAGLFLLLFGKV
jgi:hypothetical protein